MQVLCPIVVGREAELAAIRDALERMRSGNGGLVLVAGEAGIGKSRLAREAITIASDAGARTLIGRAVQTTAPIPFRPLAEAIAAALRATGPPADEELGPYHGVLHAFVPEWSTSASESTAFMLLEGILRLLRAFAGRDGLLLVLEDLHWADADTTSVVEYLADNLASERVLCLGTIRSDAPGAALDLAERLAARRSATLLRPARLSAAQIAQMSDAALGSQAAAPLVRIVGERSEGVPFLIEELLSAYMATGAARDEADARAAATALPASYRELVRGRLSSLGPEARSVVTAAAMLGGSFEWNLLPPITGLTEDAVLAALRSAVDAQLLAASFERGFRFRHALVPETIVAELLPPDRSALARRAAEVIEPLNPGLPGDWCERAAGLREAAGDHAAAARHLQEAGRRALKHGALATAEAVLEHARSLIADDVWHVMGIDRQLVEVLSQAGKTARINEIGPAMLAFSDGKRSLIEAGAVVGMYLPLVRAYAATGDWTSAGTYLERSKRLAERLDDDRIHAEIAVLEAQSLLAANDLAKARLAAEDAIARGGTTADEIAFEARLVLGEAARRAGSIDEATEAFEILEREAEAAGRTTRRIRALLALGSLEVWHGSSTRLSEARDLAARAGAVASHARAELLIGSTHLMRFELDDAIAVLNRCIEECEQHRLPLHAEAAFTAAIAHAQRGDEAGMDHAIAAGESHATEPSPAPHAARAMLALRREDRAAAVAHYERAIPTISGSRELAFTPALWALLRTLDDDDDGGAASRETAAGLWSARLPDDAAALDAAEAVVLGRAGRGEEAAALFAAADASIEALPFNRHLTRRLVAEAAIDDGWGDPAGWLRESLAFFDHAGIDAVASACKALLRRAGAPVPRRGRGDSAVPSDLAARGLTSREMDVLRLVATGASNRDIAAKLVLSARTVESHVASLMRKLEIPSRTQLVAFAARIEERGGTG